MIYPNDHQPPHVHVWNAGKEATIFLDPVSLRQSDMKASDTRRALAIVEANRDTLMTSWREIHGDDNGVNSE